tara:strand:- start:104796 stop:105746 length:951 start_codon:yes stop_codon:yes gene_type:complete
MTLVAAMVLLAVLPDAGFAQSSFWTPQGPVAVEQKAHLIRVTLLTMIAVLPVLVLVPLMLWRYRYRNKKAKYSPEWEYSGFLDMLMWGVPIAIVIALSIQLSLSVRRLDPYRPVSTSDATLRVQVVGLDWKWLFIYPDLGIATMGEMAFPSEVQVGLTLTSDTVMQSFTVSALAGQIYVMPGMETALYLDANGPGRFQGENMQFNGTGFAQQKFDAVAMSDADFEAWVDQVRSTGVPLNVQTYQTLSVRSTQAEARAALGNSNMPQTALFFATIPDGFFAQIVDRYRTGHPVRAHEQPGAPGFDAPVPAPRQGLQE